jgi:hypothetical protein
VLQSEIHGKLFGTATLRRSIDVRQQRRKIGRNTKDDREGAGVAERQWQMQPQLQLKLLRQMM